jgi:hypothetical protein
MKTQNLSATDVLSARRAALLACTRRVAGQLHDATEGTGPAALAWLFDQLESIHVSAISAAARGEVERLRPLIANAIGDDDLAKDDHEDHQEDDTPDDDEPGADPEGLAPAPTHNPFDPASLG